MKITVSANNITFIDLHHAVFLYLVDKLSLNFYHIKMKIYIGGSFLFFLFVGVGRLDAGIDDVGNSVDRILGGEGETIHDENLEFYHFPRKNTRKMECLC